jgi:hypothetical protein
LLSLLPVQEGDLLVHFPGGMKKAIATLNRRWLRAVPLLPPTTQDLPQRAAIFTVSQYRPDKATQLGRQMHVSLASQLYASNSSQQTDFRISIEPQVEGFSNWGWPVSQHTPNREAFSQQPQQQHSGEQQQPTRNKTG